jgi:hypothetical protein
LDASFRISPGDDQKSKALVSLPFLIIFDGCTQAVSAMGGRHWRPEPQQHQFTSFLLLFGLQIRYIEVARGGPKSRQSSVPDYSTRVFDRDLWNDCRAAMVQARKIMAMVEKGMVPQR